MKGVEERGETELLYRLYCSRYKKSWIGRYGQNGRQTEMQTVIRADMYKAHCGLSLPGDENPDLLPTITRERK